MIRSFRDSDTERLFRGEKTRRFKNIQDVARRKLDMIEAATKSMDLMAPPGNRLEKLSGNREGQYSIRVNKQWRVCFEWADGDAYNVEIVDYHT